MKHQKFVGFVFFVVVIATSACSSPTPTPRKIEVEIVSLREKLPALQARAAEWYPDAYLVKADIPIQINQVQPWLISAEFHSPTHDHESLGVTLGMDGQITVQSFQQTVALYQPSNIFLDSIKLDSQQALSALLNEDNIGFMKGRNRQCSELTLERDVTRSDEPVIWILDISGCTAPPYPKYTFLNPETGESGPYVK